MRFVGCVLQEWTHRLDRRARRLLIFLAALALVLFAGTTTQALRAGNWGDGAAGAAMLGAAALAATMGWSAPRRR